MRGEIERIIETNRREYAGFYSKLKFVNPGEALKASKEREFHIEFIKEHAQWGFNRTKADCRNLSKGCQLCGEGNWSCLFINNACNANCFYCPTHQEEVSQPTTQTVDFPEVEDYIAYIRKFNFRGVSISGGEPFLTFDKSMHFIKRIKEEFGDEIYLWLYTNGILANEEKLQELKNAGLDEIRFDIGATGYKTDKVELACRIFDTVTVEIPAVPEEFEHLKVLMVNLSKMGVNHLNLHQIRCTPHNHEKLIKRNYTFLHGPKITVLESELTALRLIRYGIENSIPLPVNYCSFIYKYRYQRLAARQKFAPFIMKSYEDITQTGMIRKVYIKGEESDIFNLLRMFRENNIPESDYELKGDNDTIYLRIYLLNQFDFYRFRVFVGYDSAFILPGISYRNVFKEVKINTGKTVFIERANYIRARELSPGEREIFEKLFIENNNSEKDYRHVDTLLNPIGSRCPVNEELEFVVEAYDCERLRWGLLDYY